MLNTPRKTRLYNTIAKDYKPKEADMMICQYIEGLEARIATLEAADAALEAKLSAIEALLASAEKSTRKNKAAPDADNEAPTN